ncbi:nuclear transport factor 2 family protein [Denitromonas ohlonensis]|uniref:Nuclear transport factor 2 family protein n=2 Tax=Denitromonas TaxID=139331 RepID=A0A557RDN6_9RHOO|nr:nuclear transport factor 2 family protein [Denitromonas ohlonensis]TVO63250.1 nuclear transport factor 2 family protein [Denitromonas ohlonensis]TVO76203.1 nuclear transport factor 2 family protein [Denitromonas ohlonensis]TVT77590.1 MAG: nuclear transport factor 2 family protein [Denitromonas halophila]
MVTLDSLVRFYETLTPTKVDGFAAFYAEDAHFVDPFNDVHGIDAIKSIFSHMFEQLGTPRFVVTERFERGDQAMLIWALHCRLAGRDVEIIGASHLRFDASGRVTEHRDFWDAAGGVYEELPLMGALMRWLRRRLAAPQTTME